MCFLLPFLLEKMQQISYQTVKKCKSYFLTSIFLFQLKTIFLNYTTLKFYFNYKISKYFHIYDYFFSTRPPPGLLPVLGPLVVVQMQHTCHALPCSYTQAGFEPTKAESSLLSDQRSTSKPPRLGYIYDYFI